MGLVSCTGMVPWHPSWLGHWSRAHPAWLEGKKPLLDAQIDPWSIFSPNYPNSQKALVLLTNISLPGKPKDEVAQEDGKTCSMTRNTHWDGDEPGHTGIAARLPSLPSLSLPPRLSAVHRSLR